MHANVFRLVTVSMVSLTIASIAMAQPPAAPQRQGPPRPVLLSQGSIGEIGAIVFSHDSRFLYVAGADKVIRTWSLVEGRPNEIKPVVVQTMRWEIARGYLGSLRALAIEPHGQVIAGAGISARDNGDIGLWDPGTGRFAKSAMLPVAWNEEATNGHLANVTCLSFSPNGKKLASIDFVGAVWIWDLQTGNGVLAQPGTDQNFNYPPQIVFITDTLFATSILAGQAQLSMFDTNAIAAPRRLLDPKARTTSLIRQRSGPIWASADETGAIRIWNGPAAAPLREIVPNAESTAALSMSFLGDDRIVVARDRLKINPPRPSRLEVWNWQSNQLVQSFDVGVFDLCRSVAVSPDNRWIAYAFQDTDEVRIIPVGAGPPAELPKIESHIRLAGRGQAVWEAQFVDPGLKLRLRERRPREPDPAANPEEFRGFDLGEIQTVGIGLTEPVRSSDADAGGWTASVKGVEGGGDQIVELHFNQQLRGRIVTDENFQGSVRNYCWIAEPNTKAPFAIAIGTARQDGIYVYSLPDAGGQTRLLRYFRDHVGAVTSLSVSSDRRLLASASIDQTVKVWSLESLRPVGNGFKNQTAWGADFVNENGRLIARNVLANGIAARRGIKTGDQLLSVRWGEPGGKRYEEKTAARMLQILSDREIYKEFQVTWLSNGQAIARAIVPGWEPLATLFLDRHNEWVMFTPEGVFDASAAEGPKLLGWQFNRGRDVDPEFFEAGELQKDLQQPAILKGLLTAGNPIPAGLTVADVSRDRPILTIISPKLTDLAAMPDQKIEVEAMIEYPQGTDRSTIQNEIYVNSQRVSRFNGGEFAAKPSTTRAGYLEQHVKVDVTPSERLNSFRISTSTTNSPEQQHREVTTYSELQRPRLQKPFNVYLLAISCGNYDSPKGVFAELPVVKADGDKICQTFQNASGPFYALQQVWRMDDSGQGNRISRTAIQKKLIEVTAAVKASAPNDLLVIYLSGHGHVIDHQYRFIPSAPAFIQGQPDKQWLDAGVGWSDFDAVCSLPCRKMFLFDTCRAGDLAKTVSPLFDGARFRSTFIVSATSIGEASQIPLGFPLSAFTHYWIEGMKGDADGARREISGGVSKSGEKNQIVEFGELLGFVREKVPKVTQRRQYPCLFDRQSLHRMDFELCTVSLPGNANPESVQP